MGRVKLVWIPSALLLVALAFACGGEEPEPSQPTEVPATAVVNTPIPAATLLEGICLPTGPLGVSPGDTWTLRGSSVTESTGAEPVTTDLVTVFTVVGFEDSDWSVGPASIAGKDSNANVKSASVTVDALGAITASEPAEALLPTVKVTGLGPVLTLDWECHRRVWMSGWEGTTRGGATLSVPSVEEIRLQSGTRATVFAVDQTFEASGTASAKSVERRAGYDVDTGRLVLVDISTTEAEGDSTTVTAIRLVLNEDGEPGTASVERPAPVESASIEITTGEAGTASLVVTTGLPNSCYSPNDHTVATKGVAISVNISNRLRFGPDVACAEIYRTLETRIPLGDEIEACEVYFVRVNGMDFEIQAVAPNVRCASPGVRASAEPRLGEQLSLKFGEVVRFDDEGLMVGFLDIKEDSRCPSDVTCIQAGRVTIFMDVAHDASRLLSGVELTLEGADPSGGQAEFQGFTIRLLALEPYPVSTVRADRRDYTAIIVVTE